MFLFFIKQLEKNDIISSLCIIKIILFIFKNKKKTLILFKY